MNYKKRHPACQGNHGSVEGVTTKYDGLVKSRKSGHLQTAS
jgi:hypothetical protein